MKRLNQCLIYLVRAGFAVMHVEYDDGDEDGEAY